MIISPYATHRMPEVYHRPEEFRPERWFDGPTPGRGEFITFGGGAHRCLGHHMATTELTVMLATLLARGPFRVTQPRVRAVGIASMRPRDGMLIELG